MYWVLAVWNKLKLWLSCERKQAALVTLTSQITMESTWKWLGVEVKVMQSQQKWKKWYKTLHAAENEGKKVKFGYLFF